MRRHIYSQLGLGLLAALFVVPLLNVMPAAAESAQGLQLSPSLVNLDGDPGKTYTVKLSVTNVTAGELTFTAAVNDFTAKNETGVPEIELTNTEPPKISIVTWVNSIPAFTLQPHQSKDIDAMIAIPADAEPGGHYGVIRFTGSSTSPTGNAVGLVASAGTLMLIRVSGDITENLNLITYTTLGSNGKHEPVFENGPITFEQRYQNTGNIHVAPTGQIEVKNMVGTIIAQLKVNTDAGNVLPGSIRRFDSTLNKQWLFGRYTATVSIGYGTTGGAIVRTLAFWVIPWRLILICLLGLATLIFILVQLVKRYNRFIIARATNHEKTNTKTKAKTKRK